ncbi:MAG: lysylphosphatidylglycerol synthase transmembrane domain-containing protein [Chlorobium sp.]
MTKKSSLSWTGYVGLGLGIILIIYLFSQLDLYRSAELISSIGFSSAFILLPFLALHLLETFAWTRVFPRSIITIPFFKLLKIQLIAETVSMTLPAGVAVGEPLRPFLCNRFIGIPLPSGVASVAVRKLMLGVAQGLYTIIGSIAGFSLLQVVSVKMLGFEGLGYLMVGVGMVVFLLFLFFLLLLLNGKAAQNVHRILMLVPFKRLKSWLLVKESGFLDTDEELKSYRGSFAGKLVPALFIYLLAWSTLALESYIILRLMGIEISFLQVLTIDIALTMLRTLFFFIPSGLGVQDLGYLAFFQSIGMPDVLAYGGAFVLLRRFKELLWYAFGYGVMLFSGVHLHDAEGVGKGGS